MLILELSVGMTTEGIEVRSVGNTRVSYILYLWVNIYSMLHIFEQIFSFVALSQEKLS